MNWVASTKSKNNTANFVPKTPKVGGWAGGVKFFLLGCAVWSYLLICSALPTSALCSGTSTGLRSSSTWTKKRSSSAKPTGDQINICFKTLSKLLETELYAPPNISKVWEGWKKRILVIHHFNSAKKQRLIVLHLNFRLIIIVWIKSYSEETQLFQTARNCPKCADRTLREHYWSRPHCQHCHSPCILQKQGITFREGVRKASFVRPVNSSPDHSKNFENPPEKLQKCVETFGWKVSPCCDAFGVGDDTSGNFNCGQNRN